LVRADLGAESLFGELEATVARMGRVLRSERRGVDAQSFAAYARRGVDVSGLPLQHDLVDYVRACAETGREVHLVTSAAQEIADAVAARVGGIATATGTAPDRTMTNADKLALVEARFPAGFAYAGRAPQLLAKASAVVIAGSDTGA